MKFLENLGDKDYRAHFGRVAGNAVGLLATAAIAVCLTSTILYFSYKYLKWLWE